jgi:hypothetical protein
MYCSNCGKELADGSNFCPNCGGSTLTADAKLGVNNIPQEGTITFKRERSIFAKSLKTKITVDGNVYGEIRENDELRIQLPFGTHHVELKTALNPPIRFQAIIDGQNSNILYPFTVEMSDKEICNNKRSASQNGSDPTTNAGQKKKHMGCLSAICVVAIVMALFIVIVSVTSMDTSDTDDVTEVSNNSQSEASEKLENTEPIFTVSTGTVGDWEITVNDFYYSQSVSVGLLHEYRAEDNSQYCIINVTVKNIGNKAATFLPYISLGDETTAKIKWGDYEYIRSELVFSDDPLSNETLNPLVSATGNLAFELPDELINSETAPVLIIEAGGQSFTCELIKQ